MKLTTCLTLLAFILNVQYISAFSLFDFFSDLFYREIPTYKFTYFDIKLRGEFIRFILSYSGAKFDDNRVKPEDWISLKPKTPFGQLPVLEIKKGSQVVEISQSQAIARYLANEFGLNGRNNIENALIDMCGAQMADLFNSYANIIDRLLKNGNGFLVGKKLSWADIYLSQLTDFLGNKKEELLSKFQLINTLDKKIRSIPRISNWIQKRPKTDF
ncbi:unnamed protein product [Brachionus calyciflorus]|uniref:glutathione transferase n=1 Tax=Brachionus calyciflorus TaxID=104777 RepID=A0A813WDB9_9BILA|nr:unnamed protein product [Brachionus calyciflorus]